MELSTEELQSGVIKINLIKINLMGRLDLMGVDKIDLKLSAIASTPDTSFIVDMSNVSF